MGYNMPRSTYVLDPNGPRSNLELENLTLRKLGQGQTVTLAYESLLLKELFSEKRM